MVFPLLPVMQIFFALSKRPANSISEITGMPALTASLTRGAVSGMPGLLMISSALRISSLEWCPSSIWYTVFFQKGLTLRRDAAAVGEKYVETFDFCEDGCSDSALAASECYDPFHGD